MTYQEKLYASIDRAEINLTAAALTYRHAEDRVRLTRNQADMDAMFLAAAEFSAAQDALDDVRDQFEAEEMASDFCIDAAWIASDCASEHAYY